MPTPAADDLAAGAVPCREHRSTAPDAQAGPAEVWFRRVAIAALVAFLVAGAAGRLGPRRATATARGQGMELEITYAEVSRPGLATPWSVSVRSVDGRPLPEQLTIATSSSYFELFDENGLAPQPTEETDDGERTILTFSTSPGADTFTASFDARLQPTMQEGARASTELLAADGTTVAAVTYETAVVP